MTDMITCPSCGSEIAVSETLTAQTRESVRREFDAVSRQKEAEFRIREQELETSRSALEREVSNRVAQERERLVEEAACHARESVATEIRDMSDQLAQANDKIAEAQKAELQLRRDRRDLEHQKNELELTVARTLDDERRKLREETRREADEEYRLKEADKDMLVSELRRQIDELKRKAEQGIPQIRGEVMELQLEELLRQHFPTDVIEPIPVGTHGGDVLQHVRDGAGQECGTILWESKRTKCWSDGWLPKLRDDQRTAKAELAVLTSVEMPEGLATFDFVDGVWITSQSCLVGLAAALRAGLMEVARTRRALEGKQTKVELLYNYLSSVEFCRRIEGIVEAFTTMKQDLDSEKRSMQRIWAKREKQLDRAATNNVIIYGDLG